MIAAPGVAPYRLRVTVDAPALIAALAAHHGEPPDPLPRSAFEWIVWDNVAYLVDDATRAAAFATLGERVGLTPHDIAASDDDALLAATSLGRMPEHFARKLRAAAELAL